MITHERPRDVSATNATELSTFLEFVKENMMSKKFLTTQETFDPGTSAYKTFGRGWEYIITNSFDENKRPFFQKEMFIKPDRTSGESKYDRATYINAVKDAYARFWDEFAKIALARRETP
jgi:adenosine deaminase